MKKHYKKIFIIIIILVILCLVLSYIIIANKKASINETSDIDTKVNLDKSVENINWSNYNITDITLSESLTITEEGIYNLSGVIEDGYIKINSSGNVKLILNDVNITNSNGPAIYIEQAKNVLIYLEKDTKNYLEDGSTYVDYEEDINSVIYSKDDLIFDGEGTLEIKSNYQDGIVCKDDLKFVNGIYNIDSIDDAIRGKDSVYIIDGNFNIISGGDAIKSTNDKDIEKGYILIENGTFKIESELDGLQAESKILIYNGDFDIITGGGSDNSSSDINNLDNWGNWGRPGMNSNTNKTNTDSAKGIKAIDNLVIENGTFNLNTSDDAIHSNNYVGIINGKFNISSGDDGIHADAELIIDGGNIDINKSYEGLEAAKITINDGTINVVSTDDGINVAGGNDSSSMNRPGENNYSQSASYILTINGGSVYVNSSGDGLDANGSIYINGGEITVDGPTDNGNGALDYDYECVITDGVLIAVGSSGMSQGMSSNSTQYSVLINFSTTYQSNKKVEIVDSNNKEIISYTPTKNFSSIVLSTGKLKKNTDYTIKIDGETYSTFTTSMISSTIGNMSMNPQGGAPNNRGGRH